MQYIWLPFILKHKKANYLTKILAKSLQKHGFSPIMTKYQKALGPTTFKGSFMAVNNCLINSSQTFRNYFCPLPLFTELEIKPCGLGSRIRDVCPPKIRHSAQCTVSASKGKPDNYILHSNCMFVWSCSCS